jgi:hypothetical protein
MSEKPIEGARRADRHPRKRTPGSRSRPTRDRCRDDREVAGVLVERQAAVAAHQALPFRLSRRERLAKGKLLFKLHGEKLAGLWELVHITKPGDKQEPWFLFYAWARPLADYD